MNWEDVVVAAWRRGQEISAVGPGPVEIHLDHARAVAATLDPGPGTALDLGCGAGIPGLALAGLLPDKAWTFVDSAARRVRVVADAVTAAGWNDRVRVVHARAEVLARSSPGHFDVIVARLFGPPAVTAECAAPLLSPGGQLLVTEPTSPSPQRWNTEALSVLGLGLGRHWSDPGLQELRRTGDPEDRFPRKAGVARKRPLW